MGGLTTGVQTLTTKDVEFNMSIITGDANVGGL